MKRLGIWMWPQEVYEQGGEAVMTRLAAFGVTDVFLLTKGLAGKVCYHRTRQALPVLYPDRDILQEALDAAHRRDMRLHCWFTSANDAQYKQTHPEAGNAHIVNGRDNSVIRMADADYVAYMTALVRELFATYAADGLHLDYIRYNHVSNGWAREDVEALAARGVDVQKVKRLIQASFYDEDSDESRVFDAWRAGDPDVRGFAQYRRETVRTFAAQLIEAARTHRPSLPVSAAMMPEGAYADIAFSELHYGQNYQDAAGLFDFIIPMAYHVEYKQPAQWVAEVCAGATGLGNRTLAGIQAYGKGSAQEAQRALEAVTKAQETDALLQGACLFRYGDAPCEALFAQWENT